MGFPPESTDEDHHVHPRDGSPDNRERLDASREKGDQVIPRADMSNELPNPLNPEFDPLRTHERNDNEREREQRKKNSNGLGKVSEGSSDHR